MDIISGWTNSTIEKWCSGDLVLINGFLWSWSKKDLIFKESPVYAEPLSS